MHMCIASECQFLYLGRQEGVDVNIYKPLEITVQSNSGEEFTCRTYQLVDVSSNFLQCCDQLLLRAYRSPSVELL